MVLVTAFDGVRAVTGANDQFNGRVISLVVASRNRQRMESEPMHRTSRRHMVRGGNEHHTDIEQEREREREREQE